MSVNENEGTSFTSIDDVRQMCDSDIKAVIADADSYALALALTNASAETIERFARNMSETELRLFHIDQKTNRLFTKSLRGPSINEKRNQRSSPS